MDLTILIFLSLFVVACLSLFLIYTFGFKEKSYEEALAEQRQQTSTLLKTKSKIKGKKSKKASKQPKEKTEKVEQEEGDNEKKENTQPMKHHIEFKEEVEEILMKEEIIKPVNNEPTKNKMRPILVNKREKSPVRKVDETQTLNRFEDSRPKDDFELMRSNSFSSDKKVDVPVVTTKNKKSKQVDNASKNELLPSIQIVSEEKVVTHQQTNNIVVTNNNGKEKKKKKNEYNNKQQMTAERDELINSVRKAELSKTEIQLLIDLLLNKQLEAPAIVDEWSEGKSDPVQKLKKQLAEKEKLLAEEQEALAGAQNKLREIRSELQAEKIQLQHKIRGLEEILQAKQIELQAANNRFQVNNQKIQQLQAELNNENLKTRKLCEENGSLQMQIKQYEVNLSQMQDSESIMGKMQIDLDDLITQNQHLQQIIAEGENQQQVLIMQMNNLEKGYKETHQELEKSMELNLRQEAEWKREVSNLNSALQKQFEEKRTLEHSYNQLNEQLRMVNNEKSQLKAEVQQLRDELNRMGEVADGKNNHEVEILNLSNELSSTRNELSSKIEELQQIEKRYKSELDTCNKKYVLMQKELEEQKIKNNELRTKNWKVMEALNAAESKNKNATINSDNITKKLSEELLSKQEESHKQFVQRLFPDIKELKSVNVPEWQDKYAQLIKNYIDNLKEEQKSVSPQESPEKSTEIAKLQAQILHYKNIIDDTEGMLNKLQKHVEQEEMNWRSQLTAKESELEQLKDIRLSQGVEFAYNCMEKSLPLIIDELQAKLANVENRLSKELEEKQKLVDECQLLKSQKTHNGNDSNVALDKLSDVMCQLSNNSTNGPAFIEAEKQHH